MLFKIFCSKFSKKIDLKNQKYKFQFRQFFRSISMQKNLNSRSKQEKIACGSSRDRISTEFHHKYIVICTELVQLNMTGLPCTAIIF